MPQGTPAPRPADLRSPLDQGQIGLARSVTVPRMANQLANGAAEAASHVGSVALQVVATMNEIS